MHDGTHDTAMTDLQQLLADRDRQIADLTEELVRWKKVPHVVALSHQDARNDLLLIMRDCYVALKDWLHTYAHELCDADHVRISQQRICQHGGTLAYIADLLDKLRRAGVVDPDNQHPTLPDHSEPSHIRLRIGSRVIATKRTAVCDVDEIGLVYEVYPRKRHCPETCQGSGYSIIFEQGRYDGFSSDEADTMLANTGELEPSMMDYRFSTVVELMQDYRNHRFIFRRQ